MTTAIEPQDPPKEEPPAPEPPAPDPEPDPEPDDDVIADRAELARLREENGRLTVENTDLKKPKPPAPPKKAEKPKEEAPPKKPRRRTSRLLGDHFYDED
jgi:hypothetical protein